MPEQSGAYLILSFIRYVLIYITIIYTNDTYLLRWGLVPSFTAPSAQPDHYRMFNARAEGLLTKPIFSRLVGLPKRSSKAAASHHKAGETAAAATASDDKAEAAAAAAARKVQEEDDKGAGSSKNSSSGSSSSSSSGRRCVVVLNGFYEWKAEGARKQPYYIHRGEGVPLLCAGLYDTWKGEPRLARV